MTITPTSFESLLVWLDPSDRDAAGQKYEIIHAGLIRIFASKGCSDAEHLADETFDRGMKRLADIQDTYEGDPAKYLYKIATYIILEQSRPKEIATDVLPEILKEIEIRTARYDCLLECLQLLTDDRRELILDYHVYSGREKTVQHRIMADELGVSENALRVKACHIRANLEKCVDECVAAAGK